MWFQKWFNQDYLRLYSYHDFEEAEKQVEFIIKTLQLNGTEKILDLGCGMGRHSIAFAKKGYKTVGVDLSIDLIERAQRLKKDLPVEFIQADMFSLPSIGRFDVALNLFTSFGYYEEDEKNAKVFKVAHQHLREGGKFFLDYLHPEGVSRKLIAEEQIMVEGEPVLIFRKIEGDFVIKRIIFPNREYLEKIKLYSKDKIAFFLNSEGFQIIASFNDYSGNPWAANGDRQLFYCQKRS